MSLYVWLKFFHLFGLVAFLFVHGVSGGASFALRGRVTASTRMLLELSRRSSFAANPALLVVIVTGVWMAVINDWWRQGWPWVAIGVLVLLIASMFFFARPYYLAREAPSDEVLAQRLGMTRPEAAAAVGLVGLTILVVLMVFKPL